MAGQRAGRNLLLAQRLAKKRGLMVRCATNRAGVAQWLELQPSKLVVEGSNPFARCRHAIRPELGGSGRALRQGAALGRGSA